MKKLHFIGLMVLVSLLILATISWWRARTDQSPIATVDQVDQGPKLQTDLLSPALETNHSLAARGGQIG
jgi:hypothetical protein